MNRFARLGVFVLIPLAALTFAASRYMNRNDKRSVSFRTAPVTRGDLQATISATGTVEPEEVVDVGAQVAGQILSFGKDKSGKVVDYGSYVQAGTVLARIDDALFSADVALGKAQVEQAKAGSIKAEADLGQLRAKLFQAERDWNRAKKLGPSDALSQSDFDASQSAYEVAKANLEVGKAAIAQAKGAVLQAEASLRRSQQNLDYCTIKSPVDGVIIDRRVNIGQTVVASLNAPSLFLIAKDIRRLQIWISVNEADIGHIRPGQPVSFTADAYPGEVFQGEVGKIRLNATMTQNVVTYTVEVITDNSNGKLLPYLTANAKFMVNERKNVLMTPNAALRWIPQPEQMEPKDRKRSVARGEGGAGGQTRGTVWVLDDGFAKPVAVVAGLSDGSMTEIQGEDAREGMQVIVGEQPRETVNREATASPFTPQLFGRGGGRGGGGSSPR